LKNRAMGKPAIHNGVPMLPHKLAEIVWVDNAGFCSGSGNRARLEPAPVNPFLDLVGAVS